MEKVGLVLEEVSGGLNRLPEVTALGKSVAGGNFAAA